QYNEFGLKKQGIALAIGLLFESDIRALGQDAYEGAIATVPWFWQLDSKASDWAHKFEKAFGKKPSFDQAAVYSAVTTYLDAVKRAKTDDPDKVIAALEGHKFSDFFAHGARYMLEAFPAYAVGERFGIGYWPSLLLAPLAVGIFGVVLERVLLRRLYDVPAAYNLLLTFGLTLLIQDGARILYGIAGQPYAGPEQLAGATNLGFTYFPTYRL